MTLPKILRQNPKQSLKDFKRGLEMITPKQRIHSKMAGNFWAMLGGSTASLFLFLQIFYSESVLAGATRAGFALLMGGVGWLQFVEWRTERQKLKGMDEFAKKLKINLVPEEAKGLVK